MKQLILTYLFDQQCLVCFCELDNSAIRKRESELPGQELIGNALRIVGWCSNHVPEWALHNADIDGLVESDMPNKSATALKIQYGPIEDEIAAWRGKKV